MRGGKRGGKRDSEREAKAEPVATLGLIVKPLSR